MKYKIPLVHTRKNYFTLHWNPTLH